MLDFYFVLFFFYWITVFFKKKQKQKNRIVGLKLELPLVMFNRKTVLFFHKANADYGMSIL